MTALAIASRRRRLLWIDINSHIACSHIAEHLGNARMASRHLSTVSRLLAEVQRLDTLYGDTETDDSPSPSRK